MSDETAEFPFPFDVTDAERATARSEISKHTRIVAEEKGAVRFAGREIGKTGPIWRYQYLRMYQLAQGFLVVGHELRKGIAVFHADSLATLPGAVGHDGVAEFLEDELRFRGIVGAGHAPA